MVELSVNPPGGRITINRQFRPNVIGTVPTNPFGMVPTPFDGKGSNTLRKEQIWQHTIGMVLEWFQQLFQHDMIVTVTIRCFRIDSDSILNVFKIVA